MNAIGPEVTEIPFSHVHRIIVSCIDSDKMRKSSQRGPFFVWDAIIHYQYCFKHTWEESYSLERVLTNGIVASP